MNNIIHLFNIAVPVWECKNIAIVIRVTYMPFIVSKIIE